MGWNVVKEDERYIVTDNDTLKRLVTSTTELKYSSHNNYRKIRKNNWCQTSCKKRF